MSAPVLVVGGGLLGAALARQAAAAGREVVVASRTPRPHPGLWVAADLGDESALAVARRLGAGADVVVAVRGLDATALGRFAAGLRGAAWVVAPLGERVPGARGVEVGPLFGPDDRCLAPLLPRLREGRGARLPRGFAPCRPLYVEDAARAVWALVGAGGPAGARLVGPDRLDAGAVGELLAARFGGRVGVGWLGGLDRADVAAMERSAEGPDDWDDARFGARRALRDWIERLPGPRPRR